MAFVITLVAPGHLDDVHKGRVESSNEPLQYGFLAGAHPAFEQDDGALAVDNLRKLQTCQAVLQCGKLRIRVPDEGIPSFKFC